MTMETGTTPLETGTTPLETGTTPFQFEIFWRGRHISLWCDCGKSIDVSDGRPLGRERDRHRCGPAGSPWDQSR